MCVCQPSNFPDPPCHTVFVCGCLSSSFSSSSSSSSCCCCCCCCCYIRWATKRGSSRAGWALPWTRTARTTGSASKGATWRTGVATRPGGCFASPSQLATTTTPTTTPPRPASGGSAAATLPPPRTATVTQPPHPQPPTNRFCHGAMEEAPTDDFFPLASHPSPT